jgi:Tol biopolymer transport system component
VTDDGRPVDQLITRWLREDAESRRASYGAETLERLQRTPQRRLAGSLKHALRVDGPIVPAVPRAVYLAFALLLLLLALAISLLVAGWQRDHTPPTGPAGNGVIAYASEDGLTFLALDGSRIATRLRGIGIDNNVTFSPDGSQVAFLSRKPLAKSGEGAERLFIAHVEGDGSARDITGDLVVWNLDDAKLNSPSAAMWSPDGTRLAYSAFDFDAGRSVIAIARVDGSGTVAVVPDDDRAVYTHPEWSPDGQWLTVRAHSYEGPDDFGVRLVLMRSDGSAQRVLAQTSIRTLSFATVVWAPDGRHLAYDRQDTPPVGAYRVVRYDLETGTETPVNPPDTRADDPAWSPDGQWIAYREDSGPDTAARVVVADATDQGRPSRDLGPVIDCDLAWSPDGAYLLGYAAGCEGQLAVVPVDDPSHLITLDAPGAKGDVSWQRIPRKTGG